jgi:hypothetical protein
MSHDLSTETGLFACLEEFMEHLTMTFLVTGTVTFGIAVIATVYQGKRLPAPKLVVFFPDDESDEGFLARAYRRGIDEHKAVGVFTFGQASSVDIEDPAEIDAWRDRDLSQHPAAYKAVQLKLEHTTFGVRLWIAPISKDGKVGRFELQTGDSKCAQGDFLDALREHPSTA